MKRVLLLILLPIIAAGIAIAYVMAHTLEAIYCTIYNMDAGMNGAAAEPTDYLHKKVIWECRELKKHCRSTLVILFEI